MKANQYPTILFVEDEDTDIVHFKRLAKKSGLDNNTLYAEHGEKALDLLRSQPSTHGVCQSIVLTDINMPGMTGHELIEDIRKDPKIKNSIIFVISTSDLDSDMQRAYENNVAGYFIKDPAGASFAEVVAMLGHYRSAVAVGLSI